MDTLRRAAAIAAMVVGCSAEPFGAADLSGDGAPDDDAAPGATGGALVGLDAVGDSGASPPSGGRGGGASVPDAAVSVGGSELSPEGGAPASQQDGGGDPPRQCALPQIAATDLPDAFTWQRLSWQEGSQCVACATEPCGQCRIGWGPVEQDGAHVKATLNYHDCSDALVSAGPCGSEVYGCAWWSYAISTAVVEFDLVLGADGWTVESPQMYFAAVRLGDVRGLCGDVATIVPDSEWRAILGDDLLATVAGSHWDCPEF